MSSSVPRRVFVVGVGMTKFMKPGVDKKRDYNVMAKEAIDAALRDAGSLNYDRVEQAVCGYVYGDSTCGQRALYEVGLSGIPIYNVNNNCSTGSTALLLAKQLVEGGSARVALAVGFEKMERGSLTTKFRDRTNPLDQHVKVLAATVGISPAPMAAQMFGAAGMEHMERYGTTAEQLAKIAVKNHRHSVNNPNSQFQQEHSLDEVLASPTVFGPLTKLQCCPTSDGAAAAILMDEETVIALGLQQQAIEILAMEMVTDTASTFDEKSCIKMVGFDMTRLAAERAFRTARLSVDDIQVVELHDCFTANELITYEALGLCPVGGAGAFIDRGDNTYGGRFVVNPSGGLISKGHPLGATGLAQCAELSWQLRGIAGKRQVANARVALQQNVGLGGASVVALYRLGFPNRSKL